MLALLGVLGVALAVGVVWRGRADVSSGAAATGLSSPVVSSPPSADLSAPSPALSPSSLPSDSDRGAAVIVVDVVGAVARPGVVRLSEGARVVDAISAAGGVLPGTETSALNLARLVADGEQVAVGIPAVAPGGATPGRPGDAGGGGGATTFTSNPAADSPLDLNTASAEELEELPGVGPVLAGRIVDWRTRNGRFASVDELNEVSGIGDATFAELAPAGSGVSVG